MTSLYRDANGNVLPELLTVAGQAEMVATALEAVVYDLDAGGIFAPRTEEAAARLRLSASQIRNGEEPH